MKLLVVLALASLFLLGCLGGQQPQATATPQATAAATVVESPTPTPTPQATASPTPSPAPAPEFTEMTFKQFVESCSQAAALEGVLQYTLVRVSSESISNRFVLSDSSGEVIPVEGELPAEKPASLDASGNTRYKFFAKPAKQPKTQFAPECFARIERIEATKQ